jgi:hypothetical protein
MQMYEFAGNSVHYLLSFWQRMVASMPYVRPTDQHMLNDFVPAVTKAYIESRMALAQSKCVRAQTHCHSRTVAAMIHWTTWHHCHNKWNRCR